MMFSPMIVPNILFYLATTSHAAYTLQKQYDASNFEKEFDFRQASDYPGTGDPTHGFVNYLGLDDAKARGLFKTDNDQVYLGSDFTTKLSTSVQGRDSIRVESKANFSQGLLIADIAHMPGNACGVWPSLWTYNLGEQGTQPPLGEIDIIEGFTYMPDNVISLHTCNDCTFTVGQQSGSSVRTNCALGGDCLEKSTNGDGCGTTATQPASFGDAFNTAGGGVYAMELTASSIRIWHWTRSTIPQDIKDGVPDPSTWPTPMGDFEQANGGCKVGEIFQTQSIIINTAFCGDDPDAAWGDETKCSSETKTCKEFVANNPAAFTEAYWLYNSLSLYQTDSVTENKSAVETSDGSCLSSAAVKAAVAVGVTSTLQSLS